MARKWAIRVVNEDKDPGLLNEGIGRTCVYEKRDDAVRDAKWLTDFAKARKSGTVYEVVVHAEGKEGGGETAKRKKEKQPVPMGLDAFL